jgi:Xaa-Pro aminopeptidase
VTTVEGKLSPAVFRDRRNRLAALLEKNKLDGYFFSGASDLYYLTGFHSEGFYGLATGRGVWLFVSALLAGQVRESAPGCRLVVGKRLSLSVEALMKKYRFRRVGFDPDQLIYRLGDVLKKKGLVPTPNVLEELRVVKGEEELDLLRKACRITAQTVADLIPRVRPGQTERELAWRVADQFHKRGAVGIGFDLIAAVGSNTALPHHIPGEARLAKGSPVLFDVGCRVGAYRSDLTRSFYYGKIPSIYRRIYVSWLAAQRAGIGRR